MKEKTMSLASFLEIKRPVYETLHIIPHTGTRNYNTGAIARMVADMYKSITKSIKLIERKLIVETAVKCSYMIDIRKSSVDFYFIVPRQYKTLAKEKISQVWPQATIQEDKQIEPFTSEIQTKYQLSYKNLDGFSLAIDKKSNAGLNGILNVLDIMQDEDRIGVFYNFMPTSQNGWASKCKHDSEKYYKNEPIAREFGPGNVLNSIISGFFTVMSSILDGLGSEITKNSPLDALGQYLKQHKKELTEATNKKRNDAVINAQIAVISGSNDRDRAVNNAVAVCQSYQALDGDNELKYRRLHTQQLNLLDYSIRGAAMNKVSAGECQNFLQLPGRELLQSHKIDHVNVLETKVVDELLSGYIWTGNSTYKGFTVPTYFSPVRDINNLPFILLGPMGSGKTFYFTRYIKDVIAAGEGVACIDYIKKCELADAIRSVTPPERLLEIDLSKESDLQALAYNEYKITGNTPFERAEAANLHQQQITALIDGVYIGDPLSGQMRKFFTAAADVVLINDNMSLRDVVSCLEDHTRRREFIDMIPADMADLLKDQAHTLKMLDETKTKKEKVGETTTEITEVVGTKYAKIEHILDRVNALSEDIRCRLMYNLPANNNIDFSEAMNQGKVIIIKMPADRFRSEHVRNVLVTFFISKIWLACNMRGAQDNNPMLRYHLLLDEIFQAPTAYKPLSKILRECRKFQLRLVFTAHQLADLKDLQSGLKSAGASYMLLQKTDKANFKELEQEFSQAGFTLDDLLNLKLRHSLNLISHSGGYCSFISDLTVK